MSIENLISKLEVLKDRKFFFIVGMAKSGTTWLMHALNGHRDILCSGEDQWEHLLPNIKPLCEKYNQLVQIAEPNQEKMTNPFLYSPERRDELIHFIILQLFLAQSESSNSQFLGSKQPNLWQMIDGIQTLLPSAKFINIIRDGRDVAVSMREHNLRANPEAFKAMVASIPEFVGSVGANWVRTQRALRDFGSHHPANYCEVRYEDLLLDFDAEIHKVLEFIGANCGIKDRDACRNHGSFERLSGRARGEENRSSFFRKGVAEDWRNSLDDESIDAFIASGALAYMKEFGYSE